MTPAPISAIAGADSYRHTGTPMVQQTDRERQARETVAHKQ